MSKKRLKVKQEEHVVLATQLEIAETSAMEKQKSTEKVERVVRKLTFDLKASQEHIPVLQASTAKLEERLGAYCVSLQAEISSLKEQVSAGMRKSTTRAKGAVCGSWTQTRKSNRKAAASLLSVCVVETQTTLPSLGNPKRDPWHGMGCRGTNGTTM